MPDYSKCIIYTIRTPTGLYVGSTCNYTNRKYQHSTTAHNENNKNYNLKLYKNIRENDDEWEMKPYSEFPCENKMQMNIEEERVRRELNADLNSRSCYSSDKETLKINRKISDNKYYLKNKDTISKYQKEYAQLNKEKLKNYHREYMKEYREKKKAEQIN